MRGIPLRGMPFGDVEDGMHPGVNGRSPVRWKFTLVHTTGIRGFPHFDRELALPFK
jgi:hypothetical protein